MSDTEKSDATVLDEALADDKSTANGGGSGLDKAIDKIVKSQAATIAKWREERARILTAIAVQILWTLRFGIVYKGREDLSGKSKAYRAAIAIVLNRLTDEWADDERKTFVNGLARYGQDNLWIESIKYVVQRDQLSFTDTEIARLAALDYKAIKNEKARKVVTLVATVNAMYAAGDKSRTDNDPRSGWERDDRKPKSSTGSGGSTGAAGNSKSVIEKFSKAVASKTVAPIASLAATAESVVALQPQLTGSRARYGDGGRAAVIEWLTINRDLFIGVLADVNGDKLTTAQVDAYTDAWNYVVDGPSEDN